ncbi:WhiB family transcriptional regulator [Candidatus Saccharibacteria bacterium]|nr:WhiB family transcriptional regulator [Candidatus Saccharibacteria bacterium]
MSIETVNDWQSKEPTAEELQQVELQAILEARIKQMDPGDLRYWHSAILDRDFEADIEFETEDRVKEAAVYSDNPIPTGKTTDSYWRSKGSCLGANLKLFYPDKTGRYARANNYNIVLQAKAICETCVVRVECLENALENNEQYGIWGGKTEDERDELLRRQGHSERNVSA